MVFRHIETGSTPATGTKMKSLETSAFQGFSFISNGLRAFVRVTDLGILECS